MDIITSVMRDGHQEIERFAFASGKTFAAVLLQAAKGAVRHVISITPPASATAGPGSLDSSSGAKARGLRAIKRDLYTAFAPVKFKRRRQEQISGTQLVQIHQRLLASKRPGSPMKRDRTQPDYVDAAKFRLLLTKLSGHVGKLAAGWMPAATALGLSPAQWISRHGGGRGSVQVQITGASLFVRAVNIVPAHAPAWVGPEMQRRADRAVGYARNDLARQLPYLLQRDARSAGFVRA